MKKTTRKLLFILFTTLCMYSCSTDYDVTFSYSLNCSDDLLEFVTPVATISHASEAEETIRIQDSDWNKSGTSTVEVGTSSGGVSTSVSTTQKVFGCVWNKNDTYDEYGVRSMMTVRYERKTNAPKIEEDRTYIFAHGLSCTISAIKEKKGLRTSQDVNLNPDLKTTVYIDVKGTDVEKYVEFLVNNPDKKGGSVDEDGNVKRE